MACLPRYGDFRLDLSPEHLRGTIDRGSKTSLAKSRVATMTAHENFDIFISYKRVELEGTPREGQSNVARAKRIRELLKTEFDIRCFLDTENLHENGFPRVLEENIRLSRAVLFIGTHSSFLFGSPDNYAAREWQWAQKHRKRVIYCTIDNPPIPKMISEDTCFDWTSVGLEAPQAGDTPSLSQSGAGHQSFNDRPPARELSNDKFRLAMAAIGDTLLPEGARRLSAYQDLASAKAEKDIFVRARRMLKWASNYTHYPCAGFIVDQAMALIEHSNEYLSFLLNDKDSQLSKLNELREFNNKLQSNLNEANQLQEGIKIIGGKLELIDQNLRNKNRRDIDAIDLQNYRDIIWKKLPLEKTYDGFSKRLDQLLDSERKFNELKHQCDAFQDQIYALSRSADSKAGVISNSLTRSQRRLHWAVGILAAVFACNVLAVLDYISNSGFMAQALSGIAYLFNFL